MTTTARDGAPLTWHSAPLTHIGKVRRHNEDACLARPEAGLWAVADGMGGHEAGDYASQAVMEALASLSVSETLQAVLAEVKACLDGVNRHLRDVAAERGQNTIIGTTFVGLLAQGSQFACLWAGDSRLYRYRGLHLALISHDHSLVQEMVDQGALRPEDAEGHPRSNVITRALGATDTLQLEIRQGELLAGDRFLLCSDGLTRVVPETDIARLLSHGDPNEAAQSLVDAALERGGPDNVTVVVVQVEAKGPQGEAQKPS